MSNVRKWADEQQFIAAPMRAKKDSKGNIQPAVYLLSITPDPLGHIAAFSRMYKGIPTYSLEDVTDKERESYFHDAINTKFTVPLETVQFTFMMEGVTRALTHQAVRTRMASFAQESMRFAVKDEPFVNITYLPPYLQDKPPDHPLRVLWDKQVTSIEDTYHQLIDGGMPSEEARGIVHHAITTRILERIDLNALANLAGNRLCTQAEFPWRLVFTSLVQQIRLHHEEFENNDWQYETIANSKLFRPACYQQGSCPFGASFDRACTIKSRVDDFAHYGISSNHWQGEDNLVMAQDGTLLHGIHPGEWLLDPGAARVKPG